jgi:hypothetical protein
MSATSGFDFSGDNKVTHNWEDGSLPFDCGDFVIVLKPGAWGPYSGEISHFETDKYGNVLWEVDGGIHNTSVCKVDVCRMWYLRTS